MSAQPVGAHGRAPLRCPWAGAHKGRPYDLVAVVMTVAVIVSMAVAVTPSRLTVWAAIIIPTPIP